MNMLELQLLIVVSGVPERRVGPTLLDSSRVPLDLHAPAAAKASAASLTSVPDLRPRPPSPTSVPDLRP